MKEVKPERVVKEIWLELINLSETNPVYHGLYKKKLPVFTGNYLLRGSLPEDRLLVFQQHVHI